CGDQHEAEPAVALRGGLLSTRRPRESHQGTALWDGDRAYQLHEFLGQSVPCVDDCRSLRVDAGAALRLAGTASARAQVSTLRERFLKIGAQVVASVRRIVLHLPRSFPY